MLLAGVILWSLGTLVAPPAAKMGLLALCASRVFVRAPWPLRRSPAVVREWVHVILAFHGPCPGLPEDAF